MNAERELERNSKNSEQPKDSTSLTLLWNCIIHSHTHTHTPSPVRKTMKIKSMGKFCRRRCFQWVFEKHIMPDVQVQFIYYKLKPLREFCRDNVQLAFCSNAWSYCFFSFFLFSVKPTKTKRMLKTSPFLYLTHNIFMATTLLNSSKNFVAKWDTNIVNPKIK